MAGGWVSGGFHGIQGQECIETLEGEEVWGQRQERHPSVTCAIPGPTWPLLRGRQLSRLGCMYRMIPCLPSRYFTSQLFSEMHRYQKVQFQTPRREPVIGSAVVRCLLTLPSHCQVLISSCCTDMGDGHLSP